MVGKKFLTLFITAIGLAFLSTGCLLKKDSIEPSDAKQINPSVAKQNSPKPLEKKSDLYSSTPYELPLFSIVEISKLSNSVKTVVDKLLEDSQGFYLLRKDGEQILVILQNPVNTNNTFNRHGLQFAEIDSEGKIRYHNAGYQGVDGEIFGENGQINDEWFFDETTEPKRPLKHIVYNEKKKIKFVEYWNYDENEPIKYQMKDSNKKVISILKESQDNDSNFRKEHVFYDNEGNTKMSLTINYDGANLSRVTFYNAHDLIDSMSIISEYENGLKVKELIYNEDYELTYTVLSDYTDGERKSIKILDKEGIEIEKI